MPIKNLGIKHITTAQIASLDAALDSLTTVVMAITQSLSDEERIQYGSIQERNKLFVNGVYDFDNNQPALRSPDVDWTEFDLDYLDRKIADTRADRLESKSATTAIAAPVAERLGGDPSLTAVVVIVVGVFGALVGPALLQRIGVRNRYVFGLSLGAAAHIVGTTRARDEGPVEESAAAAALVGHGVLTAVLAWAAVRLLRP